MIQQFLIQAKQHESANRLAAAEQAYRRVLDLEPKNTLALYHLGSLAIRVGNLPVGVELIGQAVHASPNDRPLRQDFAFALGRAGRLDEAVNLARATAAQFPATPAGWALAKLLLEYGDPQLALEAGLEALRLRPDGDDELHLLPSLYIAAGHFADALRAAEQVAKRFPTIGDAQWNYAFCALLFGDFPNGLEAFEWRLKAGSLARLAPPPGRAVWHREDLSNKSLSLYCEGGFGDDLQFCRFIPQVVSRAARVTLMCRPEMLTLFQEQPHDRLPVVAIIPRAEPIPPTDFVCPLPSLPYNLHATLDTILRAVPYITADPTRSQRWKPRVDRPGLKVGLCWAGSYSPRDRRTRSLLSFAPLADIPNVTFFSLQKGLESWQAINPPPGMNLIDLTPDAPDFADLAAIIDHLDLIISVDTSIAHLAAAMGKPIWTLVPFVPDFRWLLDRDDSPWYPTMRLFRQGASRDWTTVINRIAAELRTLANSINANEPPMNTDEKKTEPRMNTNFHE